MLTQCSGSRLTARTANVGLPRVLKQKEGHKYIVYSLYFKILTKDSVTVAVDAVCYFRIRDPVRSVKSVENAHRSTQLLAQTTLRNHLGLRNLAEILSERDEIAHNLQESLDVATDPWGVKVSQRQLGKYNSLKVYQGNIIV